MDVPLISVDWLIGCISLVDDAGFKFQLSKINDQFRKEKCPLLSCFRRTSSNIIQHHPTSSNIIQHHPTSSNIIQHHPTSSNIIQHHPTSSNIIQHHPTSSNIIQHHPTSSNYQLWKMATAAAPPVSTTPTQSTDGVVPVISASDSTSTTSSSLGAAFVCRCNSWESPIYLERNTQWECFIGDSFGIPLKNYLKKNQSPCVPDGRNTQLLQLLFFQKGQGCQGSIQRPRSHT